MGIIVGLICKKIVLNTRVMRAEIEQVEIFNL